MTGRVPPVLAERDRAPTKSQATRRNGSAETASRERLGYEVNLTLTIPERRELKKRAGAERRSLSNYVARFVVGEIASA